MSLKMPLPDEEVLSKRDRIVAALRAFVPAQARMRRACGPMRPTR